MSQPARDRLIPVTDADAHSVYYDEGRGTYHTWCDATDYEPVSTAVVMALSSIRGVEPDDLESLSARVDPDALNAIGVHWYGGGRRNGAISFPYADCTVTVRGDGEIVIEPDDSLETPTGS